MGIDNLNDYYDVNLKKRLNILKKIRILILLSQILIIIYYLKKSLIKIDLILS